MSDPKNESPKIGRRDFLKFTGGIIAGVAATKVVEKLSPFDISSSSSQEATAQREATSDLVHYYDLIILNTFGLKVKDLKDYRLMDLETDDTTIQLTTKSHTRALAITPKSSLDYTEYFLVQEGEGKVWKSLQPKDKSQTIPSNIQEPVSLDARNIEILREKLEIAYQNFKNGEKAIPTPTPQYTDHTKDSA